MNNNTYQVVYEPRALEALSEISFYYAEKGGEELASRMFDNITMQLDKLTSMPFGCQATDFCKNIRKMVIKTPPYLAYYTIIDTQVRILELVHASRNQDFIRQKYENL